MSNPRYWSDTEPTNPYATRFEVSWFEPVLDVDGRLRDQLQPPAPFERPDNALRHYESMLKRANVSGVDVRKVWFHNRMWRSESIVPAGPPELSMAGAEALTEARDALKAARKKEPVQPVAPAPKSEMRSDP